MHESGQQQTSLHLLQQLVHRGQFLLAGNIRKQDIQATFSLLQVHQHFLAQQLQRIATFCLAIQVNQGGKLTFRNGSTVYLCLHFFCQQAHLFLECTIQFTIMRNAAA